MFLTVFQLILLGQTSEIMITNRMPTIFFGHGSPMNAIETNVFTETWAKLGKTLPRPKAILCVSAHWETNGIKVTSNTVQKTIHDFGGFPDELFKAQYTPPGSLDLCKRIQQLVPQAQLDSSWGLDHGTWSILKHMYPDASIPVVQLSLNTKFNDREHYELAQKLKPLRDEGILLIGSGNVVHNLREIVWTEGVVHPWAKAFDQQIYSALIKGDKESVFNYSKFTGAKLAVPTRDHFTPLFYIMGFADDSKPEVFLNTLNYGSLSMTSYKYD